MHICTDMLREPCTSLQCSPTGSLKVLDMPLFERIPVLDDAREFEL